GEDAGRLALLPADAGLRSHVLEDAVAEVPVEAVAVPPRPPEGPAPVAPPVEEPRAPRHLLARRPEVSPGVGQKCPVDGIEARAHRGVFEERLGGRSREPLRERCRLHAPGSRRGIGCEDGAQLPTLLAQLSRCPATGEKDAEKDLAPGAVP